MFLSQSLSTFDPVGVKALAGKDPTRGVDATEPSVMILWNYSLGFCVSSGGDLSYCLRETRALAFPNFYFKQDFFFFFL